VDVTALDGRAFGKFVAAGTYFLRKYRTVLDDLNVFPVPDGDTGSNMYLTARAALAECAKVRGAPLNKVAAAAAQGSLLGARGNSGVIFSQMLRGFAHNVRHRPSVDSLDIALALREAVVSARQALVKPVEGTILSVASAAADAAFTLSQRENDLLRLANGIVRAAAEALERTPEQLPILKEAGVVDSGGAGLVYFLEGILRFLPDAKSRATAFPRRPSRKKRAFAAAHVVAANKYCTEFVLEDAGIENHPLRDLLGAYGDSLLVVGAAPTLRVHVHTADPDEVKAVAARHGRLTREKVEDMEQQHRLTLVEAPAKAFSSVVVVPGEGFAAIARELGADAAVLAQDANPSVRELLLAVNACLAERVYLLANDPNVALAAREVVALAERETIVVPTRDVPSGFAALLELSSAGEDRLPAADDLLAAGGRLGSATAFFTGKDSLIGGILLKRGSPAAAVGGELFGAETIPLAVLQAALVMTAARGEPGAGGLLTIYYGGAQKERDARALAETLREQFPGLEVEYYYGGQRNGEYVISLER
jgi:DAK2 domain fusion protein YloV